MAAAPRVLRIASRSFNAVFRCKSTLAAPISSLALSNNRTLQFQLDERLRYSGPLQIPVRWYGSGEMTESDLTNRVVNVVKMFDKVTPDKVTVDAHFVKDLGLDSLDAVEIVMAFEDEFGVEISDEEAEKILSCQDAINLLKVKMDIAASS